MVTIPKSCRYDSERNSAADKQRALMYEFAKMFSNTYVVDLREYAPLYDKIFRENFFLNGHMAPTGYILTAKFITSYIDYIIRHNMNDFGDVGLMGYDYIK